MGFLGDIKVQRNEIFRPTGTGANTIVFKSIVLIALIIESYDE